MFYTIYKITNQVDGKIYIGSHKTSKLDDGYMGSGKYLKRAQELHGLDKFTKEILFVFDTPEEMYAKEAELVNEDFLATENTYNLKVGGFGGWDYLNSTGKNIEWTDPEARANAIRLTLKELYKDPALVERSTLVFDSVRDKAKQALRDKYPNGTFLGCKHTQEARQKIGERNKIAQAGQRNSQYGSMWITDGTRNAKIKKDDPVPNGWKPGRITKIMGSGETG